MALPKDVALLNEGHEEKFDADGTELQILKAEGSGPRRFKAIAYSGVDVSRAFGRMVVDVEGMRLPEKMGMLLEHDDLSGISVCDHHSKAGGKLKLEGYFLDEVASAGKAQQVIAKMDQGWPFKQSIGIRFRRHSFYEDGVSFKVNGRELKGPMVCVDECDVFETSWIHVNPADLDTEASVMSAEAQQRMANEAPEKTRDELLAEGEQRGIEKMKVEGEYESALQLAFPGKGEKAKALRLKARQDKLSIDQIKTAGIERMQAKLMRLEKRSRLDSTPEQAVAALGAKHETATSPGIDPTKAQVIQTQGEILVAGTIDEKVSAELRARPRLHEIFRGGMNGAPNAIQVMSAWHKVKDRRSTRDGAPVLTDLLGSGGSVMSRQSLEKMAQDVRDGFVTQRLDVGSAGPDYSKATVNGFQGSFYNSYEEELSKNWSSELSFQIPSDQQAEIVRWLGPPPMIQEWKGPRVAKNVPIYQQLIQAKKFEGTLDVDRFDWDHQKFELIARSFGLFGAVASQHWDIIFTQLLEANPIAYDSFALYSPSHTLGGDSGTIVNDYNSNGAGGLGAASTLAVADPTMPTPLEWANIILQLTPKFRTFAWANGIKMHATARQWVIMVHPDLEGNLQAALSMERLDLGASNPLYSQRSQYTCKPNPYLTSKTYGYIFRADTQNKALLRAEPDPIEMMWQGPGSAMAFAEDKYAMGLRAVRAIAPGAFESTMRFKLGAP